MQGNNQFTNPWTQEENTWMRERYATSTKREVLDALPGRTIAAIKHQASRLGVRKTSQIRSLTNSKTNTGKVRTLENRARISASLTGQKQSDETKLKRANTLKKVAKRGSESHAWKGEDITKDESRWRARRMIPPGPCAMCEKKGRDVHHKDGDPYNNDPSNLIRLCSKHHRREHVRMDREKKVALGK